MNSKKQKAIFFFIALYNLIECKNEDQSEAIIKEAPLHYLVISIGGIVLLIVSALIYWQSLQEDKIVEFTVFNSQYVGK